MNSIRSRAEPTPESGDAGSRRHRWRWIWRWGWTVIPLLVAAGIGLDLRRHAREEWLTHASPQALLAEARRARNDAEVQRLAALRLWEGRTQLPEALAMAERAATLAPRDPRNQLLLGYLYVPLGRPAEGLRSFELACRLDPGLRKAHDSAGQIYVAAGMPDEALRHLQAAWDPAKPEVSVRIGLVKAVMEKGQPGEAERLCREMLQYAPPGATRGYWLLYRIMKAQGRAAEAEQELQGHLRRHRYGLQASFFAMLAAVALDNSSGRSRLDEARRFAQQAMRRAPESIDSQEAMGAVLAREGRHVEAIAHFRQALAYDSEARRARALLASSLRAIGRWEEAARYAPPPPTPEALKSVVALREQLGARAADAGALLQLASALERANDPAGAFRACWVVLQRDPSNQEALQLANRTLRAALNDPQAE
jgi:tetratricopeptide (TPR) repeat protein